MKELEGKKVLLVALTEYSKGIIEELKKMGAVVDYICDKPNDGVICKTLGRIKFKPYIKIIEKYYRKEITKLSDNKYDYILVIRGEYTPSKSVKLLKSIFPNAKIILYMWDSVQNNKGIEKKWKYYDKVWTFDRIDYLEYKKEIGFLPLFYYNSFLPKKEDKYQFDIAFIGTGHDDRIKIIKEIKKQCDKYKLQIYEYIFLPHFFIYLWNKLKNKNYKDVKIQDVHFNLMPTKEAYDIYSKSRCVIDIESSSQSGLTMRTIEMIGLKKKLITTNKDIVNYEFYNKNNIMVVDRSNFKIDPEFVKLPYINLDEKIYKKYSLHGWILQVLEIEQKGY